MCWIFFSKLFSIPMLELIAELYDSSEKENLENKFEQKNIELKKNIKFRNEKL